MSEHVTFRKLDAGTAEILIDRPERHNAMTIPMYEALLASIVECQRDANVRCVLLRGAGGKSF
ncbi:MAG TPA: enoyl-CoA hydratase/isomerase family protein, partial [Paraburkholderia sp.]|nr:enoyl-CoA hydratase/isomerase family protein [Paraburkholderia sp.]